MKVKIKQVIIISLGSIFVLSACSYKQLEDSVRSKAVGEDVVEESANVPDIVDEPADSSKNNTFTIGDSIIWSDYYKQEIEYTLDNVETASNINELKLVQEDFSELSQPFILSNGEVTNEKDEKCILVAADIRIRNISFKSYDNGKIPELFNQINIDRNAGSKDGIMVADMSDTIEADYFNEHSTGEKDYYKFILEEGAERLIRLAWIVPEKSFEKPFYYIIGTGMEADRYQYFQLNKAEESL